MGNIQTPPDFYVHVCSRNPIATWAIERLLTPRSSNWRFGTWFPKQLLILPQGVHILLIDACSIAEWPEAVRKWTDAGHKTILLVAESWDSEGAEIRALHLGVRGIVHVSHNFIQHLSEAVNFVAKGQLFASEEILDGFYFGSRRLRPRSAAPHLSFREEQVIDLLMKEFSNRRIGTVLGISERTAKFHVCNVLRKLQMRTRREFADKYANEPEQTQTREVMKSLVS
jgi:DNA-binding NarL/FixJ family response regulator